MADIPVTPKRYMILLVGIPGSGKSTFAKNVVALNPSVKIFSQDAHAIPQKRIGGKSEMMFALKKELNSRSLVSNMSIIIDRCNFNKSQRSEFIDIAKSQRLQIIVVEFVISEEVCREKMVKRLGEYPEHPTIKTVQNINSALEVISGGFEKPAQSEFPRGSTHIRITSHDSIIRAAESVAGRV